MLEAASLPVMCQHICAFQSAPLMSTSGTHGRLWVCPVDTTMICFVETRPLNTHFISILLLRAAESEKTLLPRNTLFPDSTPLFPDNTPFFFFFLVENAFTHTICFAYHGE